MSDNKPYKTFTITRRNGDSYTVTVDADRYDEVAQIKWSVFKPSKYGHPYVVSHVSGTSYKTQYLHRYILGMPPAGMVIDHISGDTFDNRLANLRFCTIAENSRNRIGKRTRAIGGKGVHYIRRYITDPWHAYCTISSQHYDLGRFPTAQQAQDAYNEFAKAHHGEFFRPGVLNLEAVAEIEREQKEALVIKNQMRDIFPSQVKINPWLVKVAIDKKRHYLGCFPTIEAARTARDTFLATHTTEAQ